MREQVVPLLATASESVLARYWFVRCYRSREAFEAEFADPVARRTMLEDCQRMRREFLIAEKMVNAKLAQLDLRNIVPESLLPRN